MPYRSGMNAIFSFIEQIDDELGYCIHEYTLRYMVPVSNEHFIAIAIPMGQKCLRNVSTANFVLRFVEI